MTQLNIIVPAAGESVTEADIAEWKVSNGDYVNLDDALIELETDKASLDLTAEGAGILSILIEEGTVNVGDTLGYITLSEKAPSEEVSQKKESEAHKIEEVTSSYATGHPSPAAAKILAERQIDSVVGTGKNGRVTKQDAQEAAQRVAHEPKQVTYTEPAKIEQPILGERKKRKEKMSRLRRTVAKRLVNAQQTQALLTTFNEVDLTEVMAIRKKYKEKFKDTYQVNLGFMSFFTKATCEALKQFPIMNASVEEQEIVYHDYADIGIAVSTPKGLVVPVIRDAGNLSFRGIEESIVAYAKKGRAGQISLEDMEGGTFTITNGGTFGSMLSTPIVNFPQSAILGMHNIIQRPMAVKGEVKIRPMMYLAVSYDHRIIDGSDAVRFLVTIKELLEDPARLLIGI